MIGIEAALEGRLGRDPELKMVKNGSMPMLTRAIAVDEAAKAGEDAKTTWVSAKLFGDKARAAAESFVKGDRCYVEGKLSLDSWTGQDGQARTGLSVLASKAEALGKIGHRRPKQEGQRGNGTDQQRRAAADAQRPLDRGAPMYDDPIDF